MNDPLQQEKVKPSTNGSRLKTNIQPTKRALKNVSQVPLSSEGLLELAQNGNWKESVNFNVLLLKMGNDSKLRTSLAGCHLRFEHSDLAAQVLQETDTNNTPFSLTLMKTLIPHFKGSTQNTLNSLYFLLHKIHLEMKPFGITEKELVSSKSKIKPKNEQEENQLNTLKIREKRILFYIINCHLILNQYSLVLELIEKILEKYQDLKLKSLYGLIYIETGMIKTAKNIFDEIEKETENPEKDVQCRLNRAFLNYGNGLYSRAIEEFNAVLSIDPKNVQAANNCAICYLNCRNLENAMGLLEDLIMSDPNETLNEISVSNLKMLYNLGCDEKTKQQKLKHLRDIILKFAPDDFLSSKLYQ
eukprot:gene4548-7932_t